MDAGGESRAAKRRRKNKEKKAGKKSKVDAEKALPSTNGADEVDEGSDDEGGAYVPYEYTIMRDMSILELLKLKEVQERIYFSHRFVHQSQQIIFFIIFLLRNFF